MVIDALSRKDRPSEHRPQEQIMLQREVLEFGVYPNDQEENEPKSPTVVAPILALV